MTYLNAFTYLIKTEKNETRKIQCIKEYFFLSRNGKLVDFFKNYIEKEIKFLKF